MSGTEERQERTYLCPDDGGVLLISDLPSGVLRAVFCRKCGKRHVVHLGGRQTPQLVSRNADGTPRPANAPPPIETRAVTGRRRRG